MCGIAGVIDLHKKLDTSLMEKASKTMRHRGPDGKGSFYEKSICLLHRRLSIIDLSSGSQPMFSENRKNVIVFNGEIYNFLRLREQLIGKGHIFRTVSDTEVLLNAYEEWGKDCVNKFQGMFAFAIYNRENKSLFIARDRCGEKPIYYYHHNGKFIFASEMKTLLTLLEKKPSPNPEAIYAYLRLGYIPASYSYYEGILKLMPGTWLTLQDDHLTSYRYYQNKLFDGDNSHNLCEDELCDEFDYLLSNAVNKMLISDVPLGSFLSGGLDSSLIVAMMAKLGHRPDTFSISFDQGSYDESPFANRVSQVIGTNHTEYKVELENFENILPIIDAFDEPFADSSGIPTYYLSRKVKKKVTVALSGDGSDELFGGYRRYLAQFISGHYLKIPNTVRKKFISQLFSYMPVHDVYYADSLLKSAIVFMERAETADIGSGLMLNTIFSHDEIVTMFPDLPDGRKCIDDILGMSNSQNSVESLMDADMKLYLPNDILVKVDRMSMRNSLEVRTPFLDPDILDFAQRIPFSMKIKGVTQKYLLKKLALRYLPHDIVFRKKHGFMIPMKRWLINTGKVKLKANMPHEITTKAKDTLLTKLFDKNIDCSHKIYTLIALGRYLD